MPWLSVHDDWRWLFKLNSLPTTVISVISGLQNSHVYERLHIISHQVIFADSGGCIIVGRHGLHNRF